MSFTADVKFQICQEELDDSDSKERIGPYQLAGDVSFVSE